jgi:type IV pilus assembly protein PilQ
MIVKHAYSRCSLMPLLAGLLALVCAGAASAQVALQDIDFQALSDSQFEIELQFNSVPPTPEVFVIEDPARLTMDFTNVTSALTERRFPLEFAAADSLMILEAQGRTRMVVNLTGAADYRTRVQGNSLFVTVLGAQAASAAAVTAAPAPAPTTTAPLRAAPAVLGRNDIRGIDFRGGEQNAGEIIIDLERADLVPAISQNGNRLEIQFDNAIIAPESQMRLDVTDFTTPVQTVSLFADGNNVVVSAQVDGEIDYVATQAGNQYIVTVVPVLAAAAAPTAAAQTAFSENRISLDYQNIEIRAALQLLAEFNDFSLVVGDNVTGSITLRLENVPWDQALDLILRPRNLGQRLVGTVLYVAPAEEIAAAELQELQSAQETDALAPLVTEYIEINYAVAENLLPLLQGSGGGGAAAGADGAAPAGPTSGGILSGRGRASFDARTNTLIIQDVQEVIDDARALIARLDVPVRQVLIEARIVNASTSFSQALGVRWGGAQTFPGSRESYIMSGSQESSIEFGNNLAEYSSEIASAVAGGTSIDEALATTTMNTVTFPDALLVDLGVANAPVSIALGYSGDNGLLELELSALEASGNGEVIAQPKVTTQDQQPASIRSGLQIPYQSQAGGTAGGTTTEFITAALSLDVTPQITPDGRIIMLLDIHQDSVVPGSGGGPPAISTNSVTTRVLVNDGDTIVLGGVFREETTTTVTKTPLLGDLPYVGNIFKRTEESESKTELLIFITPSIINEILQ